jgi:hypothetical protein
MVNIAKDFPHLHREWHHELNYGIDPEKLSCGSGKKVWWKCSKSDLHVWKSEFRGRINGKGCPFCAGRKVCADNSLSNNYPNIAAEWHPTKNLGLLPSEITSGSNKKVWWQCQTVGEHEWKTSVSQRTSQTTGCPLCSGRRATSDNNVEMKFPDLALEWHPSKNKGLTPADLRPKSGQIVWWRCKIHPNHEWKCRLIERTVRGDGCPYCSNHRVSPQNNLARINPNLAREWNFEKNGELRPEQFTVSSEKNVWWRCKRFPEHEWKTRIANRTTGRGCPYCTSQTSEPEIRLVCELRKLFGEKQVEWRTKVSGHEVDILLNQFDLGIEFDGLRWHEKRVSKDKQKNARLRDFGFHIIRLRETPLPLIGEHDISVKSSLTKKDLNNLVLTLQKFMKNSQAIACKKYLQKPDFINQKDFLKYLSFLPNPPLEHALDTRYPEVCMEWDFEKNHPLTPKNFLPFSHRKVWWKCAFGHEYEATIATKTGGKKCAECNSLRNLMPKLASEWHPTKNGNLSPSQVTKNSGKKVWWQCNADNEHEWQATVDNRSRGTRCPFCVGSKVTSSNNLKVIAPDLCDEWHPTRNLPLQAENFLPNSNKTVWWACKRDREHEWQEMILKRRRGKGCPFCVD